MTDKLIRFLVKLKILGLSKMEALNGIPYLKEELEIRSYSNNLNVWWDIKINAVIVEIEIEHFTAKLAELTLYDELLQAVVSTINFTLEEGITILMIDIKEIK